MYEAVNGSAEAVFPFRRGFELVMKWTAEDVDPYE